MIDPEVVRLRRLRNSALRARAVVAALDPTRQNSLLARSRVCCWGIARVITGTLRAHPYLSYQQGPSELREVYVRLSARLLCGIARYRGHGPQALADELRRLVRELDDARALTWSTDWSDTLGRSRTQCRDLIKELDAAARIESGSHREADARLGEGGGARPDSAGYARAVKIDRVWPYLAF